MNGPVHRYGARARFRDITYCFVGSVFATGLISSTGTLDALEGELIVWGALLLASTVTVMRWRWSRWASADDKGLASGGADGDRVDRIGWDELEEISIDAHGLVARGGGAEVRASNLLEGVEALRDEVFRRRGPALYQTLRSRFRGGQALDFRGPETPAEAAARGLGYLLLFALPLALAFGRASLPLGLAFMILASWITVARRLKSSRRVRIDAEGLRVRELRTRRLRWEEIEAANLGEGGRLWICLRDGRTLQLAPDLGNFVILQELILERVAAR